MLDCYFQSLFVTFLWIGTTLPFFHSDEKTPPVSTSCFKIKASGLKIAGPQISIIRMLILSCPFAYRILGIGLILAILSEEKVTEDKRFLVKY